MRRFSLPFLLLCFLLNVVVTHSQVNRRAAMDYLNRGTKEFDAGDLDGALADFNRAIELDPNYSAAYFSRGLVRRRQADYDGAISDFAKTIELNPRNAKAYANRGMIMLLRGEDAAAQKEFDTALKMDSTLNPRLAEPNQSDRKRPQVQAVASFQEWID